VSKLVLDRVSRRFDGITAVESVSLALTHGEFVSLLGPSGCGKTTTLRMIAGFLAPSEGTIAMDGLVISSPASSLPPEKRNMSMIFQSYAIWPNMTVAENVPRASTCTGGNRRHPTARAPFPAGWSTGPIWASTGTTP
jgi:iron(III) transport system ATP-binding protein